jgi:hypothetical protein
MQKKKEETTRIQVYIPLKTNAFLEILARKGTHGSNAVGVARTFIEEGIRSALEKGHLTAEDRESVQSFKLK